MTESEGGASGPSVRVVFVCVCPCSLVPPLVFFCLFFLFFVFIYLLMKAFNETVLNVLVTRSAALRERMNVLYM